MKTFAEAKEETYDLFGKRCQELLDEFLSEKDRAVCSLCSGSCTQIEKREKALLRLIEDLTIQAMKKCEHKGDFWVCLLSPYLSTLRLLKDFSRNKTAKLLVSELESTTDRLKAIIRSPK